MKIMDPIELRRYVFRLVRNVFSIREGTDVEGTIASIRTGVVLRGYNGWILICAAMLASIGLDTNSSAIIIGAMLISPLMSPIIGIGLGVGISDWELLIKALKTFGIAVAISLGTSALYFLLTPLGLPTSEMAARTQPTLLDVGVAIFGGIAGITASSRTSATNAIPGVAIATALMPPLCTAGFGLATGDIAYFLGAFYLFFINAVFISLSTYFVVRFLKFPTLIILDETRKKQFRKGIGIFIFIVMLPSAFIFWNVINKARTERNIKSFVSEIINVGEREAINWTVLKTDSVDLIRFYLVGNSIEGSEFKVIDSLKEDYSLDDYKLRFIQMNVDQKERDALTSNISLRVMKQLDAKQNELTRIKDIKDRAIDSLNYVLSRYRMSPELFANINEEIRITFPEIESFSYGVLSAISDEGQQLQVPSTKIEFASKRIKEREANKIKDKFGRYLKARIDIDTLAVF